MKSSRQFPVLSYEAREDYVKGMLRLGACYIYNNASGGIMIPGLIYEGTHIYRLTELWDGEKGIEPFLGDMVIHISELYENYSNDPKTFEEAVYELLWPFAEPAIKRDISNWPWIPEGYNIERIPDTQVFGCFAWEEDEVPETVCFHIANACMPESPFADLKSRAVELLDMTQDILNKLPEAKIIRCKSWLNSFPPFIELFPDFWVDKEQDMRVGSSCDWWGQFMKRDGSFHEKNGRYYRETNEFPFSSKEGSCELKQLMSHLGSNI